MTDFLVFVAKCLELLNSQKAFMDKARHASDNKECIRLAKFLLMVD